LTYVNGITASLTTHPFNILEQYDTISALALLAKS